MLEIQSKDFEREVLQKERAVVDFYSTECPPCEALAPKFEELSRLYGDKIHFVKIFRQGNRELASRLGVSSSPTVLFFKNGKQTGEVLTGAIKKSDISRHLDSLLSADEQLVVHARIKPVQSSCDVLILGGGPAALTASIYLAQAKLKTVVVDTGLAGGQVSFTHKVSNYPGFPDPLAGYELAHRMTEQAKKAGVVMRLAVDVTSVDLNNKQVIIDDNETLVAKRIIIATGASPRPLNIPGEKELKGKGISYCATCDAKYYQNKEVVVIGGGNSAVEESDFISRFVASITMVHQFDALTANKEAQEKCFANEKIKILFSHEPRAFEKNGDKIITLVEHLPTGEKKQLVSDGVFVFAGMRPNLEMIKEKIAMDEWGYIKTDDDMHTSIAGVFAAGDVVSKKYRQITTAVADGTIAAMAISKELQ